MIIRAIGFSLILALAPALAAASPKALAAALRMAAQGDYEDARAQSARIRDTAARDVVEWTLLRASQGSFEDYRAFLDRNPDWPGLPLLRRRGERTIPRSASAAAVLDYFDGQPPQTGVGALRLAAALQATGDEAAATAAVIRAWRNFPMLSGEHKAFLERHGKAIAPHHAHRLDHLLWERHRTSAGLMLPLVSAGQRKLAEARIALQTLAPGVDGKIAAVPSSLRNDPGLAQDRFVWRARKGRSESARELLRERSGSVASLGRPEEWANRRRSLARDLMRDDRDREAYRLASSHQLTEGRHFADLEWLSGFIALRKLDDAETALRHFRMFRTAVASPISLGRAGYWEGRALEALGRNGDAAAAYAFAAEFQTSFYGQLAAERAGIAPDRGLLGNERYPGWKQAGFADSSVLKAALALHAANQNTLAERFMVHLCESLSPQEMGQLADLAFDLGEPHIALMIAKFAARGGITLQRAYHPVTDVIDRDLPVNPALTLAIARRESEFDPRVISPAGARGLMQLMPRTGAEMAKVTGDRFSEARLITDPAFNARLGTAYLAELIEDFGPNLPLIATGYNAGPSRAVSWSRRFGDPRGMTTDQVVDWIEHVPFRETRNYIMRVTESRVVYGIRLTGQADELGVSELLTGG